MASPRIVVVTRPTEYRLLLARHGTHEMAKFFLSRREQDIAEVEGWHRTFEAALDRVLQAIPLSWRRSRIERADLDRFPFEPDDVVVVVGQDGLVANTAKYLHGQPVLGINPDPARNDGVLVRHRPEAASPLMHDALAGKAKIEERTLVEARLDDGQRLIALNEVFLGHRTHQSARYRLRAPHGGTDARTGRTTPGIERHSSSGIVVATGTGATGWTRSIHRQRKTAPELPKPSDPRLVFFVREAFPSRATGTNCTEGSLSEGATLECWSEMNEGGVLFGDGIEEDRVEWPWGARVEVGVAPGRLRMIL